MGVATEEDPFADVGQGEGNIVSFRDAQRDTQPLVLAATPFQFRDPATIPRRRFLYGYELRRGQVSAVVAPGAAGKTTLKIGRAICMALGRDLLGHRVWDGPHRVWMWNLEDEMEEVEKTVHAFLKLWNIDPADLGGRLFIDGVDSPGTRSLKLAVDDGNRGVTLQRPVSDALIAELKAMKIDYLDVDPFVSSHSVDENSNHAIDLVAKEWVRVAQATNSAISLAHHVRKSNGTEFTAADARGAGAMVNAARSVLILQRMSKDMAQELAVPECDRRKYFSVYDDKNNKAPSALAAEWYEFVGVDLGNGDETGPADNIGAVVRWHAPDNIGGVTPVMLGKIQALIDRNPDRSRKHSSSSDWAGKHVAYALDMNLDKPGDFARVKRMLETWVANGALRTVERMGPQRKPVDFLEVGAWAIVE